ncbi:hypothetical protein EST38_g8681 [Candolleomyces aberdarensis]|uniref:Uncharacterized protein n=1 Tax=Candolleomyces aberdarensis TaxID=2316362 RepID=A0A4Q2DDN7_9AGAR|nr:hypothetical protein EST38_g8681 [Candolleomyces aberdarensis]
MKEIYASGTRNSKEYEIYVKMYPDIFQPAYKAECVRLSVSGRAKLSIWHKMAREMWENASDEEKAAVQAQLILDKEANTIEEDNPCAPDDYQKFWEKLPAVLSKTVAPPVRKAGVLAFVTIVGPVPNAGGQILATTLQFGDKPDTPLFSSTWKDHDRVLVDQLATFAARYEFPPDFCAKRSLTSSQKAEDAAEGSAQVDGDVSEGTSSSASDDIGSPAGISLLSESSRSPVKAANDLPQTKESAPISAITATDEIGDNTNATSFDLSEHGGGWHHDLDWANPQVLETIARLNAPDVPPTNVSAQSDKFSTIDHIPSNVLAPDSDKNILVTQPSLLHQSPLATLSFYPPVSGTSTVVPHDSRLLVDHNTAAALFTSNAPNLSTSQCDPSALQTPASTVSAYNASQDPLAASPPFHEPVPNGFVVALVPSAPAPYVVAAASPQVQAPGSSVVAPAIAPLSGYAPAASHAGTLAKDNLETLPTTVQIRELSTVPHDSPPSAGLSTPFKFIPRWPVVNSKESQDMQPPTNENMPPSRTNSSDNRDHTMTTSTQTPFQNLDNSIRRSSRVPVPSTRLDRQNEIGTTIVRPKPSVDTLSIAEEPAWFAPAYNYLKNDALGRTWIDLVAKWAEYERLKGWKSGKGLPAKGRPEEWQQWVSKARRGDRDYNRVPTVADAADIGLAITTWVSSFESSDFGKTGPHGTVALLTLVVWWGIAALTPSSWNTDSRPQWQALVADLLRRFAQLIEDISAPKRARDDDPSDGAYENKRLRADPISF